jgi:hypothetical protein
LLFLEAALRMKGLNPVNDVKLNNGIAIPARIGAWQSGQTDYAIFGEPDASQLELDGKAHYLASIGETVGFVDYTAFIATDKYIRDNPAVMQSWTDAVVKAQKWTASAAADIVKALEPHFPDVSPRMAAVSSVIVASKSGRPSRSRRRNRSLPGYSGEGHVLMPANECGRPTCLSTNSPARPASDQIGHSPRLRASAANIDPGRSDIAWLASTATPGSVPPWRRKSSCRSEVALFLPAAGDGALRGLSLTISQGEFIAMWDRADAANTTFPDLRHSRDIRQRVIDSVPTALSRKIGICCNRTIC